MNPKDVQAVKELAKRMQRSADGLIDRPIGANCEAAVIDLRQGANTIEDLLEDAIGVPLDASTDSHSVQSRELEAMRKVLGISLKRVSDSFNDDPADPGWETDAHEDYLRDACIEYANAIKFRRSLGL